jgi:hypothetical protein
MTVATAPKTWDTESVQSAVNAILETLGEPETPSQTEALTSFKSGDGARVKLLAALHLTDNYIKSLNYLISAPKLTPNTSTILAESARSAADHVKDKTLAQLGEALAGALG